MLQKALLLLSGNAATSLVSLIRNLLIARLIPLSDYGVAATFAIIMTIVEMSSAFGLQQQIVQSKDGDVPRFQAALQGFQFARGVLAGLLMFLIAHPMAAFFNIPEAAWAYQVLAIVPVLRGCSHFDNHRFQRRMRFGPMILTRLLPAVAGLLLIWPLALLFGDWQIMLWSIVVQTFLGVALSHILAERRYALAWDGAIIAGSLRFGWPLLLNSMLMFIVFQGDKMLVGRFLGLEALAIFAMGMTLSLTPTLVLAKTIQNLFLPRLSQVGRMQDSSDRFQTMAQWMIQAAVLNGSLVMLAIALIGQPMINILLGSEFAPLLPLITAFGIMNGLRVFKAGPSVVALSRGVTTNSMIANLPRLVALPIAAFLLIQGGTITQVIWLAITAEFVGFVLGLGLVHLRVGIRLRPLIPSAVVTFVFVLLATDVLTPALSTYATDGTQPVLLVLAYAAMVWTMRDSFMNIVQRKASGKSPKS